MYRRRAISLRAVTIFQERKATLDQAVPRHILIRKEQPPTQFHHVTARTLCLVPKLLQSRKFHSSSVLGAEEEVKSPQFPDSISSGDLKIIKKEGDAVQMDEVICEIETDKTALPVVSPANGVITKYFFKNGQPVKANTVLCKINVTGAAPAPAPAKAAAPAPAAPARGAPAPAAAPPRGAPAPAVAQARPAPAPASPASATAAAAAAAAATAAAAVRTAAAPGIRKPPPAPTKSPAAVLAAIKTHDPTKNIAGTRTELPVPMNKMRQRIAERLKEAQNTTAMLTTFNECDMSKLMAFRKANLDTFVKKYGVKLSFMSPFMKAAANALMEQPVVNSVIVNKDIVYRDYVDISVAVATPRGLVVPVLRNVNTMDYPVIELSMHELASKAREGRLAPSDMQGGTFTISNGGVFGSLLSMPIINLPQSAILGMHAIMPRPVAVSGKVEIRPMMYLALTYDHRLIDGREAVLFLRKVKSGVEDPTSILAGI